MSLHPRDFSVIPEETARVARAAFPKGNPYLILRDELGVIYEDHAFAPLFDSPRGRPAESPGCLALVTALQFAENLTDRQAADAVRGRIDWKYLLGLELTDPGFDYTLLHEFRDRLLENEAEQKLLDELLGLLKQRRLVKGRGKQRTDSTHVLAAIRNLNRLELAGETMRHALNSLAVVVPDWLRAQVPAEWFDRYSHPFSEWQLSHSEMKREELAENRSGWLRPMGDDQPVPSGRAVAPGAGGGYAAPGVAATVLCGRGLTSLAPAEGYASFTSENHLALRDTEARFSVRRKIRWQTTLHPGR
jgi:transposase